MDEMTTMNSDTNHETYAEKYRALRLNILCAAQLDASVLDAVACELISVFEAYPFERATNPAVRENPFNNIHESFVAMMNDGYAEEFPSQWFGSALENLKEYQFYLAWAWGENHMALHFTDGDAVKRGWSEQDAMNIGKKCATSAQKSYALALELMLQGTDATPPVSMMH